MRLISDCKKAEAAEPSSLTAPTRPTVLQLIRSLPLCGAEMLTAEIARLLAEGGRYRPIVCAYRKGGPLEQKLEEEGIVYRVLNRPRRPAWALPVCLYDLWGTVQSVVNLIRGENVDVINAHMPEAAFIAVLAGRKTNCPVVVTLHNTECLPSDIPKRSAQYALRIAILKWTLKRADKVIACSDAAKASTIEALNLAEGEITSLPNGIAVSKAHPNIDRTAVRQSLGLRDEHRILICVSRFAKHKGQDTLIEMMPRLLTSHETARLVLCGTGPNQDYCRKRTTELGLHDEVLFLGDRSDVGDLLRASDVFVTASQWEGLSLALLEAMDAALPVVSTPAPGNTQVLEGAAGVVTASMHVSAILESVVQVLDDRSFATTIGKRGRQRLIDQYSCDRMMERLTSIYDKLIVNEPRS